MTSSCRTSIIFLTDGAPTDGNPKEIIDYRLQNRTNIDLFIYTMGTISDKSIVIDIACTFNGIYKHIDDDGCDLGSVMCS